MKRIKNIDWLKMYEDEVGSIADCVLGENNTECVLIDAYDWIINRIDRYVAGGD